MKLHVERDPCQTSSPQSIMMTRQEVSMTIENPLPNEALADCLQEVKQEREGRLLGCNSATTKRPLPLLLPTTRIEASSVFAPAFAIHFIFIVGVIYCKLLFNLESVFIIWLLLTFDALKLASTPITISASLL